jgi:chitin disaccharide deacetylase
MGISRRVIVNADDFGLSPEINRGIVEGHRRGIVTSTSLMVKGVAAEAALKAAIENPNLSFGLHVDIGEWEFRNGSWEAVYKYCDTTDVEACREEVLGQLQAYKRIMGVNPTHIDSHQHVHRYSREMMAMFGEVLRDFGGVPLRHMCSGVTANGGFWGRDGNNQVDFSRIKPARLIEILRGLPDGSTTELSCHPGHVGDIELSYGQERELEFSTICCPEVRAAIKELGIKLISYHDWAATVVA